MGLGLGPHKDGIFYIKYDIGAQLISVLWVLLVL